MDLRHSQKQVQKLALNMQLKQSLHILQLPLLELKEYIEQETEENPVIETQANTETATRIDPIETVHEQHTEIDENAYQDVPLGDYRSSLPDKRTGAPLAARPPTLRDVALRQLNMHAIDSRQHKAGEIIIDHLDENGYLAASAEELRYILNSISVIDPLYSEKEIESAISLIQRFEPIGIGARSLRECLLIQLAHRHKQHTLAWKIASEFLDDIANHKIKEIAHALKTTPEKIRVALEELSRLQPKPGSRYSQLTTATVAHSSTPDIIVEKNRDKYEIIVNDTGIPRLAVSKHYARLLKEKNTSPDTKTYVREKINAARTIINAITQRKRTLETVSRCIIERQKNFFVDGNADALAPLTLKEVAVACNRHESTISRVVNSKWIQTPYGTFGLNYFFVRPTKNAGSETISRETIKTEIYSLLQDTKNACRLTDSAITAHLRKHGFIVARRTIAKYRKELKIPTMHRRRRNATKPRHG